MGVRVGISTLCIQGGGDGDKGEENRKSIMHMNMNIYMNTVVSNYEDEEHILVSVRKIERAS